MSWQRSHWFQVPLSKQLKRDSVGHGEATIKMRALYCPINIYSDGHQLGIMRFCNNVMLKVILVPCAVYKTDKVGLSRLRGGNNKHCAHYTVRQIARYWGNIRNVKTSIERCVINK